MIGYDSLKLHNRNLNMRAQNFWSTKLFKNLKASKIFQFTSKVLKLQYFGDSKRSFCQNEVKLVQKNELKNFCTWYDAVHICTFYVFFLNFWKSGRNGKTLRNVNMHQRNWRENFVSNQSLSVKDQKGTAKLSGAEKFWRIFLWILYKFFWIKKEHTEINLFFQELT